MPAATLTFEQIDECPIYRLMRPILNALTGIPFIPANWKGVVRAFTGVMDELCPNAGK